MPEPKNQLATVCRTPKELLQILEASKGAISNALPKHLNPDRMLRLALTAFSTTPALRNCTGQSILAAIVVASQLGLEPGVRGQAYLIPYGQNCTLVPGWIGLVGLLNNSGRATAWTGAVFDGDHFDISMGTSAHINHEPGVNAGDPDKLIGAYACAKVNGAETPVIEYWRAARIWKHRDRFNKVGGKHYSFQHPEMYARKVVLLQVLKYMPASVELTNAVVAADAAEKGNSSRVESGVVIEVSNEPEVAEGGVGRSALEDATAKKSSSGPASQTTKTDPSGGGKASGESGPEETPHTLTGEEEKEPPPEPEKAAPSDGMPTLKENRADVQAKLRAMNIGPARFVTVLVELGKIPAKVPFDDLENDTLQGCLDEWDEFKNNLPPK